MPSMKKVGLDRIDTYSIKKFLREIRSPIIPLALVFEALGFKGVTGLDWGILAGAISALAIELGYKVERVGRSIVLVQRRRNLAKGKGGRTPLELGDDGGALCVH
jgi:hypothetical protein